MSSCRSDQYGYFECPSKYLKSINARYEEIMNRFIDECIIKPKMIYKLDMNDIFSNKKIETYSSRLGYCKKYKFLVDVRKGEKIDIDFVSGKNARWHKLTSNSLIELGYSPKITRDSFGRRVHHAAIYDYKINLRDKGLSVIDAKASQPCLLWLLMRDAGISDVAYSAIFDGKLDFYNVLVNELHLEHRQAAKDLFMFWVNSRAYVPNFKIHNLFPVASGFIEGIKCNNYKDCASLLQRKEAGIWIDDLLENAPVEFALPVHDSLIIRSEYAENVFAYFKAKYPLLDFSLKEL
jgi:hypothetical protein